MSTAVAHTATPWRRDSAAGLKCDIRAANGRKVALCFGLADTSRMSKERYARYRAECDADAHFIVQACNAHDDMLKTLQKLRDAGGIWPDLVPMVEAAIEKANAPSPTPATLGELLPPAIQAEAAAVGSTLDSKSLEQGDAS